MLDLKVKNYQEDRNRDYLYAEHYIMREMPTY